MRPNGTEPGHNELQSATGKKRRLKMSTVVRRLRVRLDSGNKIEAVKQARKDAGYSLHEALRLVQHCEGDHDLPDNALALSWCDPCRNSLRSCQCAPADEQKPEATSADCDDAIVGQLEEADDAQPFKCKCGDHQCKNEWHRLAMWLGEDPASYGRLLAYVEAQVTSSAASDEEAPCPKR